MIKLFKLNKKREHSHIIDGWLDTPSNEVAYFNTDWLRFSGWCFSVAHEITRVEYILNNKIKGLLQIYQHKDHDGKIYHGVPRDAFLYTYRGHLPLYEVPFEDNELYLEIWITDASGNKHKISRFLHLIHHDLHSRGQPGETEKRSLSSHPFCFFLDKPLAYQSLFSKNIQIEGWVFSTTSSIDRLEAYQDGKFIKTISYGYSREDLRQIASEENVNCGFRDELPVYFFDKKQNHEKNDFILKGYDTSGNTFEFPFSVEVMRQGDLGDGNQSILPLKSVNVATIIIPVFNNLEYTKACVESLYATDTTHPFEVIVVNNGSTDDTAEWLRESALEYNNFYYANLPENRGFAKAVNYAVQVSSGRYIVILNNDTIVTSGWLDHMLQVAENDNRAAVVSPVTNYVGAGPQIDPDAVALSIDQLEKYSQKIATRRNPLEVPDRLVFFCVLIKRHIMDQLGGLDEGYLRGNFEDDDFCFRVRKLGYRLFIAQNAFVYHHGSKTFKQNKIPHSAFRTQNHHELLYEALASLANQTFNDFEVILVNDGGPPFAQEIESFRRYLDITIIPFDEPAGRTNALNRGIQSASGMFVTHLDDDDILYPLHLDILWHYIQTTPGNYDLFYTDCCKSLLSEKKRNTDVEKWLPLPSWKYQHSDLMVINSIPIHTWVHKKGLAESIGGFNEDLDVLEDWEFLIRASQRTPFFHIPCITCEYRIFLDGSNSVSQRKWMIDAYERIVAMHPAADDQIGEKRKDLKKLMLIQLQKIERLKQKGTPNDEQYRRELSEIVHGF